MGKHLRTRTALYKMLQRICLFLLLGTCSSVTLVTRQPLRHDSFNIVAGITSKSEMCLSVVSGAVNTEGSIVALEQCGNAIAAGDGRDIWTVQPNGQIVNLAGGLCLSADAKEGMILKNCDASGVESIWNFSEFAELMNGGLCISQSGSGSVLENIAHQASVSASSSADAVAHAPGAAVDGRPTSFWASKTGESSSSFIVDFGKTLPLESVSIEWEYLPLGLKVQLSDNGEQWHELYSTDSNRNTRNSIDLGYSAARMVRLEMSHPASGSRFGIKSLSVNALQLRPVLEECEQSTNDARHMYYTRAAHEYNPIAANALREQLPDLAAAEASLAAVAAELADALHQKACIA